MYERPSFLPAGDQALVVELGGVISPETNRRVHNLMMAVEKAGLPGVLDLVPAYCTLLVYYDPLAISVQALQSKLEHLALDPGPAGLAKPRTVGIPTLYGGEYGPDLDFVAEHAGLTPQEVVQVHSGTDYLVYMMGFSPGFPYLGGLSARLTTPRLSTPRTQIPAGSVGIAENQTGVYPVSSPGGWQLIGRTPLKLFDPAKEPPSLLKAGDYVRFVPIRTEAEYLDLWRRVDRGEHDAVLGPAL